MEYIFQNNTKTAYYKIFSRKDFKIFTLVNETFLVKNFIEFDVYQNHMYL